MRFTPVTTKDGSSTLFDSRVSESYKSGHAAQTETEVVFLKPGVIDHPERLKHEPFRVLELGFGLGMNVATLYDWWKKNPNQKLEIVTVDSDLSGLRYLASATDLCTPISVLSCTARYQEGNFSVTLLETDFLCALTDLQSARPFHTVFFDPFSPKSEPDSWSDQIFSASARILRPKGRLVTYSVSRRAKDGLTNAGFTWEKCRLPEILHKRESLLAIKP